MRGGGGKNGRGDLTWEDSEKAPAQSGPKGGWVAHNMVEGREGVRKRGGGNAAREEVEGLQGGGRRGSAVYTEDLTVCQMSQGRHR